MPVTALAAAHPGTVWGRPSEVIDGPDLNDRYTLEMFYRLQDSRPTTVNGDLRLLIDATLDPTRTRVWVFGLSVRINS